VSGYLIGPGVDIPYADLPGVDLAGADLQGAALLYDNLSDANLNGANLTDADLDFANLSGVSVVGTIWSDTLCPNGTNSDKYVDGCLSSLDTTPPVVTVTGVRGGGQYVIGAVPAPGCRTTDNSAVATPAKLTVTTTGSHGVGSFTATCAGAVDRAGNHQAAPVRATYTVVYGFAGFAAPRSGATLARSKPVTVRFRLANHAGTAIASNLAAALAKARKLRVTLRGPGISAVAAVCSWNASTRYVQCTIAVPARVRDGRAVKYTITATENVGTGFIVAPGVRRAADPETVHFG
jgi:uncharacterized protein YjbI with pentapeptide repeats